MVSPINISRLKLDLFCNGIRLSPELKELLPRYRNKRASLSEGVFFILETPLQKSRVNVAVYEKFADKSPYYYDEHSKQILKNNIPVVNAEVIYSPEWYSWRLGNGMYYENVVKLHGDDVLAACLTNVCRFKMEKRGCEFCALDTAGNQNEGRKIKTPEQIAFVVKSLEDAGYHFTELNINSGTINVPDMGASFYCDVVSAVRNVSNIPISAQLLPPKGFQPIDDLYAAGLNNVSFNLEIFNEEIRKRICPGKSCIQREEYLDKLGYAVSVFGIGQASSWLIAGFEPPESTIEGIREIVHRRALPFVTVFRPLLGTPFENANPPKLEEIIPVYVELEKILKEEGINPAESVSGCPRCDGCSVQIDIVNYGIE